MKTKIFFILSVLVTLVYVFSCTRELTFPDGNSLSVSKVKDATAKLVWIGPDYKLVVNAVVEDSLGISKIDLKNGEWQLNQSVTVDNQSIYTVVDTFIVPKDVNATEHSLEFVITNHVGGILKTQVDIVDLSAQNQIPGYNPDLIPPVITVSKPTVTKFYGISSDPITIDVDATISDLSISSIEVKVWGETVDGQYVEQNDLITPTTDVDKASYHYIKSFSLPAGKVGDYQYVIKSIDASGNKAVKGGVISSGYLDRLYLSDAENAFEVDNQGFDHYGQCRGIGTLYSMKKTGNNIFTTDYYYRNESTDNIRFVAFLGSDRPFIKGGSWNQAKVNYALDGKNVVAMSVSDPGKITADLTAAGFKLPVSQKGYYHVTVNMTTLTVTAIPFNPTLPVDAVKFPGWSDANPWPYLAVTSSVIVGGNGGWYETATSPKLMKEANHKYLYTGTFQTNGSSSNISFNAPMSISTTNGWFRLTAGRANMKDDYGDLISIVGPVGLISGGANWGFSASNGTLTTGTYKATYDLYLQRLRMVRISN